MAIGLAVAEAFEPLGIGLGADALCFLMQPDTVAISMATVIAVASM
ncbi:hypothetical protein NKI59_17855 [Mesorhizobium sp. M0598]